MNTTSPPLVRLAFPQLERAIPCEPGETVLESARRHGVRIVGACGGRGSCGSCEVRIVEGEHAVSNEADDGDYTCRARSAKTSPAAWVRACRIRPGSDCTIEISPRSLAAVVRTDATPDAREVLVPDTVIGSRDVELSAPALDDAECDVSRLLRALGLPNGAFDLAAAREMPTRLREHRWKVRARLRGDRLIGVTAPGRPNLGLAIDLGTTNVAGFLVDLDSGGQLATLAIENPQGAWGADLITRIDAAARSKESFAALRDGAREAIDVLAHDLCRAVDADTDDIVDAAVCGNTAMHHLLLGLPVASLGRSPFVAALRDALDVEAREIGLAFCAGARVHFAPNVGGFVGGDHCAALLATQAQWSGARTALVLDIGTNTEITLVHDGALHSASCPSGPALEGGNIRCGMRAAEGAIERVAVDRDGAFSLRMIGRSAPLGLCGSGVVDAIAALRGVGALDDRGRLIRAHRHVHSLEGKAVARLAPGVLFTQDDVRSVQLAKAAIRTATELLLQRARCEAADIERFVVAGAFGAWLDVGRCIEIGLFPELPRERFVQVGNAAGAGIRRMLVSESARKRAREIARQCRYVELSTTPEFQKTFLRCIGFDRGTDARRTA